MRTYTRYLRSIAEGGSVERMTFFSDAVFAIAMTLLIIEVHAPEVPGKDLPGALRELLPGYLTFALSFAVVGLVWLAHARKVSTITGYNQNLLRLNLLMLLFVASIPLPTAILGRYGGETPAVVLYAVTVVATGLSLSAVWIYAWRQGFVREDITVDVFRYVLVQSLPIPGVFLLSIPVALIAGSTAAELTWIVALPASFITTWLYRRRDSRPAPQLRGAQS